MARMPQSRFCLTAKMMAHVRFQKTAPYRGRAAAWHMLAMASEVCGLNAILPERNPANVYLPSMRGKCLWLIMIWRHPDGCSKQDSRQDITVNDLPWKIEYDSASCIAAAVPALRRALLAPYPRLWPQKAQALRQSGRKMVSGL